MSFGHPSIFFVSFTDVVRFPARLCCTSEHSICYLSEYIEEGSKLKKLLLLILGISLLTVLALLFVTLLGVAWIAVVLMDVLMLMVSCVGVSCTIILPFRFNFTGRTATISGFLDCAIYIGAAISTRNGWNGVICTWGILILLGIGMLIARRTLVPNIKEERDKENETL